MGKYNLDETLAVDDPGHVEHHQALAIAGNDLDVRVQTLEDAPEGGSATWGDIGGSMTDQVDLTNALNGKAASVHTHSVTDVTGLQAALDAKASTVALGTKADAVHSHSISQVTGLQAALDGKSATGHTHAISDVTNLQTSLNAKAGAASTGAAVWIGTSAEYAAVTPKSATTIYYVTD